MRFSYSPLLAGFCIAANFASTVNSAPLVYPQTSKTNVVDEYFGTRVEDPFRWLEDDNSPETAAWVEAQNKVTFGYLEKLPQRTAIRSRLNHLYNYERFTTPVQRNGRYFFRHNNGLQNQDVILTASTLNGPATVLLDPNQLSADGTASVGALALTDDARRAAYLVAQSGSDWQEIRVRDVLTATDLPEKIEWVKFSGASWKLDGSGFYYSRYDAPQPGAALTGVNQFQKLYYHRIGEPQSKDALVYHRPDQAKWGFGGSVTDDGRYLAISVWEGTDRRNRFFYQDFTAKDGPVVELLKDFDARYEFIENDGTVFWFQTDLDAPRGRVIAIDVRNPARSNWKELIPQSDATIEAVTVVGDRFFVNYLRDARSDIRVFKLDGTFEKELILPGIGTVTGFGGKRSDRETFYSFTSFTIPGRVYRYDINSGTSSIWKEPKVDFDPDAFETKQVWVTSKDGVRLPMFITHKKGLKLDGNNPTLLYGYGGFNISLTPGFSVGNLTWLEMGGVYAVPNLRGGGEYGEEWHEGGMKLKKQNVFNDFVASAEWLIQNKYTNPKKLAIQGGSNGGLLVGACMTQRPELFGACLPAVGVMDMLRFHQFTIGWAWKSDFGSSENPEEFKAIYAYSPLHNLKPGVSYPPTLITTADHDDRVVPAHSFKFAARLQECHRGPNPVLIRIETKAGHGAGKPISKQIEERGDQLTFLAAQFGMKAPESPGKVQ